LLRDRLRSILGGHTAAAENGGEGKSGFTSPGHSMAGTALPFKTDPPYTRHSHGLEQFFAYIRDRSGLSILDLGETTQANVQFITSLGHKVYSEDFLRGLDTAFGPDDPAEQSHPTSIDLFLRQNLDYDPGQFDGVLVWDVLQYLAPPLLAAVLERLQRIVKPSTYLLSMFHSQERRGNLPLYTFRIHDAKTLLLTARGVRQPMQTFNNRTLEKLFHNFDSLKFFLTREQLREVIVKR
jgi:hypothetical protein